MVRRDRRRRPARGRRQQREGQERLRPAPVERTEASGWLWSWALATLTSSSKADLAWRYISWATGPRYIKAARRIAGGWAAIPPGTAVDLRDSEYKRPPVRSSAGAPRDRVRAVENPGTSRRPGTPGVQYVGIPEFQDVGDQCTEQFSAVIAGKASIDSALRNCQTVASGAGE